MSAHFPDEFDELLEEFDFRDEPRNYDEIREAEVDLLDRIWYVRSLIHEEKADDAEELLRIAGPGRARVEAKYGVENLGARGAIWRAMSDISCVEKVPLVAEDPPQRRELAVEHAQSKSLYGPTQETQRSPHEHNRAASA